MGTPLLKASLSTRKSFCRAFRLRPPEVCLGVGRRQQTTEYKQHTSCCLVSDLNDNHEQGSQEGRTYQGHDSLLGS